MEVILFRLFGVDRTTSGSKHYKNIKYEGNTRIRLANELKKSLQLQNLENIFYEEETNSIYVILEIEGNEREFIDTLNNPPIADKGIFLFAFDTDISIEKVRKYELLGKNLGIFESIFLLTYNDELTENIPTKKQQKKIRVRLEKLIQRKEDIKSAILEDNLYNGEYIDKDKNSIEISELSFVEKTLSNNKTYIFVYLKVILDNCRLNETIVYHNIRYYLNISNFSLINMKIYNLSKDYYFRTYGNHIDISIVAFRANKPIKAYRRDLIDRLSDILTTLFNSIGVNTHNKHINIELEKKEYENKNTRILKIKHYKIEDEELNFAAQLHFLELLREFIQIGMYEIEFLIWNNEILFDE